ncbi:trigger factor [Chloroflexota bacterium]
MKVTNEKVEKRQVFLAIEMEPDEVEESMEDSYRRLAKRTNIPGFRKGKAPRAVLERYIGKERLLEDALNSLLPQVYEKALKEQEIEAFAQPNIEIAQTDPVIFKVAVPLTPTIELGDYQNIKVAPESVEFSEDDVNTAMEQLRHQHATWEPAERPVDFNDLVVLDIESSIEGEPFVNQKGARYQVLHELPLPVPGFAEQLVGVKPDEEKEFKLQFPSDYPKSELAGKEPSFRVKVTELKEEKLPELNDEFAQQVSPEFKGLDSLREKVSADLRLRAEEKARADFEERVVEAVVGTTEMEFPPVLVEAEIDQLINQQLRRWQMAGRGLEEYLSSINKTGEELRRDLEPLATKRVGQSLTLGKIAEEEKIEVGDVEIDAEVEVMTQGAAEDKKDELGKFLNTPQARKSIEQILITRKTVGRLVEVAKGSNVNKKGKKKKKEESR